MIDRPTAELDNAKISAARLHAVTLQPYLAAALYALLPSAAPGLGTFAVDRRFRMSVDPEALDRWSVHEVAGVLLHEVGHVIRDHGGRALQHAVHDETSRRRWNLAADAELNDDLIAAGIWLPPVPVVPATLGEPAGKVVEYYFDRITRHNIELPTIFNVDCGPAAHGHDDESPNRSVSPGDEPGLENFDVVLIRARVAAAIRAHATAQGPGIGRSPTIGWRRWADEQSDPTLDWRQLLRTAVRGALATTSGLGQPSYSKPSRRRVPHVILPAMVRPLASVAILLDTSGSVDNAMLATAFAEVRSCLHQLGVRRDLLTLYAVDHQAHRISFNDLRLQRIPGGGGTDLRTGFDASLRARPAPHLIVAITDGQTPWPERRPSALVVAALLGDPAHRPEPPAWIRTVAVDCIP